MKIENDIKKNESLKRKTEESLNEVYESITQDVVIKARNDLVKSITDFEGEIPKEVINNVTSSYKQNDPINISVRKHVRESIKDRNQQYFKQRRPAVNKKSSKNVKPQLKITDIVNRNISRSSSLSSIPLNEIEMLSRSTSLDSISTMKREYNDEEMISRPPSVSSIRDTIKKDIDLSFKQPVVDTKLIKRNIDLAFKPIKPIKIDKPIKIVTKEKPTIEIPPKVVDKKTNLTPAAKKVVEKKIKPFLTGLTPITKQKSAGKIVDPPTTSLVNSIDKKKVAAAKADSKKKYQEVLVKWQNKSKDIDMAVPLLKGKRKPTDKLTSEAKTKKEN